MSGGKQPVNRLRRSAKLSEAQLMRIVYGFAAGISIKALATANGISQKSVRQVYMELRPMLLRPRFGRWHNLRLSFTNVSDPQAEALIKTALIDELALCFFNRTCFRNFSLGNRRQRICRACPLTSKFTEPEIVRDAIALLDQVRAFYERLGIRAQARGDHLTTLREMIAHTAAAATIRDASKSLPTGLPDPFDTGDLAMGDLLSRMMDELTSQSP